MASQPQTFDRAQVTFCKAQLAAEQQIDEARDRALDQVDDALDALVATPSRSVADFVNKIRALTGEYDCYWQERHIKALIADLGIFAS